ncbi:hypothetical protein GW17_00035156 [Ensete ventricosum]|nr:hypothetical protein GW17_00035156 [Ensete ventricosum]
MAKGRQRCRLSGCVKPADVGGVAGEGAARRASDALAEEAAMASSPSSQADAAHVRIANPILAFALSSTLAGAEANLVCEGLKLQQGRSPKVVGIRFVW